MINIIVSKHGLMRSIKYVTFLPSIILSRITMVECAVLAQHTQSRTGWSKVNEVVKSSIRKDDSSYSGLWCARNQWSPWIPEPPNKDALTSDWCLDNCLVSIMSISGVTRIWSYQYCTWNVARKRHRIWLWWRKGEYQPLSEYPQTGTLTLPESPQDDPKTWRVDKRGFRRLSAWLQLQFYRL